MPLSVGEKLGPYEFLALVGKGGMGEVYRAHDSRLSRDVAIKVSNAQFTERFTREARTIASLNHTNICHLYDVGPNYLVMEYVEGPDLRGPLDFEDALPIIQQVIDGIEAAHEKNIIHRDLKPANIKITPEGVVKILDFGLAKAMESPPSSDGNPENSPTFTMGATAAGTILGTAAYMAPEQAKGKAADKRSDIWSFGVVLYEVLTGNKLFAGESAVEILGGVLNKDPDISAAPVRVHKLLRWCLEKDRKQRLQAIGDARRLLSQSAETGATAQLAPAPPSRLGKLQWIAAGVLAVALIVSGVGWYRATRPAELKPLVRLDVDLGADVALGSIAGADTILSPDGTRLVYVSHSKLFTRRLDQTRAVELAGTDGAFAPFFSPDAQWVGFFTNGKLKKISVEGGAAAALCDAVFPLGGSWGEDGNLVVSLTSTGGLYRIPSSGGAPAPLTELAQGEVTHRWPQILPGGKAVLFTSHIRTARLDEANIEVMTLADHHRKTLQQGGTFGRYVSGSNGAGHLVYINKGTLFAVLFDPDKLEVRGTPSPVLEGVSYSSGYGSAQFDVSRNGTLIYRSGEATQSNLVAVQWLDAAGKTQPLLAKAGSFERPRVSPDGQRLAFDDGSDIWVYEARRDSMTRLTFDGARNIVPVWSPDGGYIVFGGAGGVWWVRSDAASKPELLMKSKDPLYPFSFTPDGKRLAYSDVSTSTFYDISVVPIERDGVGLHAGKPEIFLQTPADERTPTFSPDGRWLAYTSNESGTYQVYVRASSDKSRPDRGGKWQISNAGGAYPVWSSNGHELFFRGDDNRIMVAAYAAKTDSFIPDKPRVWSEKQLADLGAIGTSNYDLAPDGKRVAAIMPVETPKALQSQNHVIFLENFFDELRRNVPTGK